MAVRLGGLARTDRLLLRDCRRLADGHVRRGFLAAAGRISRPPPDLLAPSPPRGPGRRLPSLAGDLCRTRGNRGPRPELRHHLRLRHGLARIPGGGGRLRRHLPAGQSLAGPLDPGRLADQEGSREGTITPRLPGATGAVARRGRSPRGGLARADLRIG